MKKRIKKKVWKEKTTAQQADLMERVAALEELTRQMATEQTSQRERLDDVAEGLMTHQELDRIYRKRENDARLYRQKVRRERELERKYRRLGWAKLGAMAAFAVALLIFALMLPVPERADSTGPAEPVATVAYPAEGVNEAMALSWEG